MNPVSRDLYVDELLTNILLGYSNPLYIADMIAPLVRVDKQSGLIRPYPVRHWFRDSAQKRAPGTPSRGHGFGRTTPRRTSAIGTRSATRSMTTRAATPGRRSSSTR